MNMIEKGSAHDAYAMPELKEDFVAEVDLASRWLGGSVLAASDESFGEKESLLTPTPSAFVPGNYGPRGEIVDGWETKRRREPGHDWALIRLGAAGIITGIDVDTSFFTGNFPTTCRIEACGVEGYPSPKALQSADTEWIEIVPRSPVKGDAHNRFDVSDRRRFTHVRISAFPDGGIARLRVYGHVVPDPRVFDGLTVDLANQDHGGQVVTSSDGFYTSAAMLNRPDKARNMGDGWETRRRRDDGNDHAVIRLALPGHVRLVEIDTAHFKYNASAEVALSGAGEALPGGDDGWRPLLSRRPLQPDTRHVFRVAQTRERVSYIRLDAYPDGGISRVRLWGKVDPAARLTSGYRWFNTLPTGQARQVLAEQGVSGDLAEQLIAARPLTEEIRVSFHSADLAGLWTMLEGRFDER
ncbi:allantoicase [Mesorhizobium sp. B1-1-8]|uniref:allantoicase n=1 Tax=Mesorhizobium sp. B1-1-8 TaxID=2589976 RepID=UPI001AEEF808|nr:allantoicase [Mesorhizobium sp. B1-1-8]UCI05644.1 allantoicase [Mesorhizobium sp. B1-1-8]